MSKQRNWSTADREKYVPPISGTMIEHTTQRPDYILTQRQREAVKQFIAGKKDELDGVALARKGKIQQEMAVALLHSYGTKPKQICQITGLRPGQIQSHLEHGRIHLGMEDKANEQSS